MSRVEQDWKKLAVLDLPANQQIKAVKRIAKGNTSSVLPMIVDAATKSWALLPPHTRTWYTKEEMIAAGVAYTVTHVAKEFLATFDKKKATNVTFKMRGEEVVGCGSSFSAYLYILLQRFYITLESEPLRAEKRWEGNTVSLNDLVKVDGRFKASAEFYLSRVMKQESFEEETISQIDAQKHFMLVYRAATPTLRKYLIRWFLTTKTVRMKDGEEYRAARRELRKLASEYNFTFDMALFLANNDVARAETALEVLKKYKTIARKSMVVEYEEMAIP